MSERRRRPKKPTNALPGTPEKVEVMRLRFEAGEHIHHPNDAKDADSAKKGKAA